MSYINKMIIDGLAFGIPLFIMAVGAIYSEKSGITNLAVEGFQGFGAFCGAVLATLLDLNTNINPQVILYLAILTAFFGGAVYASLHALLCIKFRADQTISGVVINILAVALTTFLTSQISACRVRRRSIGYRPGSVSRCIISGWYSAA